MREKYESLSLGALKEVAKARGLKGISTLKKVIGRAYGGRRPERKKYGK